MRRGSSTWGTGKHAPLVCWHRLPACPPAFLPSFPSRSVHSLFLIVVAWALGTHPACRSAGHLSTWTGKGSDPDKTFADLLAAKGAADEARFEVARRFTMVGG